MLDMAAQYATERQQFGVPIGSFQAVKHQLADASLAVEFAEPLVLRAANSVAHRDPSASVHVSMAKAKAADAANGAARTSLQVHGAIGYTVEYDLHLYMAWSLAPGSAAAFHRRRLPPRCWSLSAGTRAAGVRAAVHVDGEVVGSPNLCVWSG